MFIFIVGECHLAFGQFYVSLSVIILKFLSGILKNEVTVVEDEDYDEVFEMMQPTVFPVDPTDCGAESHENRVRI